MRINGRNRREQSVASDVGAVYTAPGARRGRSKLGTSAPNGAKLHQGEDSLGIQSSHWTIPEDQPEMIAM
jgi:hypothetical protein